MNQRVRLQNLEKRAAGHDQITLEDLVSASARHDLSAYERAALDASSLGRLVLNASMPAPALTDTRAGT